MLMSLVAGRSFRKPPRWPAPRLISQCYKCVNFGIVDIVHNDATSPLAGLCAGGIFIRRSNYGTHDALSRVVLDLC